MADPKIVKQILLDCKREEIRGVLDGVALGEIKPVKALRMLSDLGVVLRTDNGRDLTGCCIARLEPIIEEGK